MSKSTTREKATEKRDRKYDRRFLLKHSVAGGAALLSVASSSFGEIATQPSQQAAPGFAAAPWVTGRIRRVVTGHNAKGRSCVVSDEVVNIGSLWINSEAEPLGGPVIEGPKGARSMGPRPAGEPKVFKPSDSPGTDPPMGGSRVSLSTIMPSKEKEKPAVSNRVGRHTTDTIDYLFVLSGKLFLILDEQEVALHPGDLVVQRNTDHAWRADGDEPARFLVTLVRLAQHA